MQKKTGSEWTVGIARRCFRRGQVLQGEAQLECHAPPGQDNIPQYIYTYISCVHIYIIYYAYIYVFVLICVCLCFFYFYLRTRVYIKTEKAVGHLMCKAGPTADYFTGRHGMWRHEHIKWTELCSHSAWKSKLYRFVYVFLT